MSNTHDELKDLNELLEDLTAQKAQAVEKVVVLDTQIGAIEVAKQKLRMTLLADTDGHDYGENDILNIMRSGSDEVSDVRYVTLVNESTEVKLMVNRSMSHTEMVDILNQFDYFEAVDLTEFEQKLKLGNKASFTGTMDAHADAVFKGGLFTLEASTVAPTPGHTTEVEQGPADTGAPVEAYSHVTRAATTDLRRP